MSRVGTLALLTAAKLLPPNKSQNMHFNGGLPLNADFYKDERYK